jgi:alcohol dehydrogenase class IV
MNKPEVWTLKKLLKTDIGKTVIWCSPSVRLAIAKLLPYSIADLSQPLALNLDTLIVIGGGTLIDKAKAERADNNKAWKLIVIPSIWGSGAEASPVVVLNRDNKKDIRMNNKFLPDVRVIIPQLSKSIPESMIKFGCGDCWAHALEGFLSPLAEEGLRIELANLINHMLELPLRNDPEWFEISAKACAGQTRSSVGLVHGIAHVLESHASLKNSELIVGHSMICSTFLLPVMEFNKNYLINWGNLWARHGVNELDIQNIITELFDIEIYNFLLPILIENWKAVLRDPCSRTNCVLVRPASMSFFANKEFL